MSWFGASCTKWQGFVGSPKENKPSCKGSRLYLSLSLRPCRSTLSPISLCVSLPRKWSTWAEALCCSARGLDCLAQHCRVSPQVGQAPCGSPLAKWFPLLSSAANGESTRQPPSRELDLVSEAFYQVCEGQAPTQVAVVLASEHGLPRWALCLAGPAPSSCSPPAPLALAHAWEHGLTAPSSCSPPAPLALAHAWEHGLTAPSSCSPPAPLALAHAWEHGLTAPSSCSPPAPLALAHAWEHGLTAPSSCSPPAPLALAHAWEHGLTAPSMCSPPAPLALAHAWEHGLTAPSSCSPPAPLALAHAWEHGLTAPSSCSPPAPLALAHAWEHGLLAPSLCSHAWEHGLPCWALCLARSASGAPAACWSNR